MRALIAFDKFKDSLTAPQACAAAARALHARHPDWTLDLCPLADGGEGFAELLTHAAGGRLQPAVATGPRGGPRETAFGLVRWERIPRAAQDLLGVAWGGGAAGADAGPEGSQVAVIEMAAASGLALLAPADRDLWHATSQGTGDLILAAAEAGVCAILLGVGGSATHDLGCGALGALGLKFWTGAGDRCDPPVPARWAEITGISGQLPPLPPVRIACDVANALLGPRGAAAVYAPQKGLRPEDAPRLERLSARMAALLTEFSHPPAGLAERPGTGAAGGIAFGLLAAAQAKLLPGFELISAWLDLDTRIAAADLVLTGEGRFDESSREGKGPGALAARAGRGGKPVHFFAGEIAAAAPAWHLHRVTPPGTPLPEALRNAAPFLAAAVAAAF